MERGTAIWTRPEPIRKAAVPAITGAPIIPSFPPTTSTRPNSPLWPSIGRGGRGGTCATLVMYIPWPIPVGRHSCLPFLVGRTFLSASSPRVRDVLIPPSGLERFRSTSNWFAGQECPRSPIRDRQECLSYRLTSSVIRTKLNESSIPSLGRSLPAENTHHIIFPSALIHLVGIDQSSASRFP